MSNVTDQTQTGYRPRFEPGIPQQQQRPRPATPTQAVDVLGDNGEVVNTIEIETQAGVPVETALKASLDLAARVEARLRDEWPGVRTIRGTVRIIPQVEEGGATDTFIRLAAKIVAEEAAR